MVYSDTKREVCPFCGGNLIYHHNHDYYQCNDCMIQIKEGLCVDTNKPYFYTDNLTINDQFISSEDMDDDDKWFYRKQVESSMFFRNITKINENSDIICPHCNGVHKT
jgi:DNA-directed RNA polymerase subunit RPC12/RpoP